MDSSICWDKHQKLILGLGQWMDLFSFNLLNKLLNEFVKLVDYMTKNVVQLRESFLGMHEAPY